MFKRFLVWLIDWRPAAKAALHGGFNAEAALRELKEAVSPSASISENADNWAKQSPSERWESQAGSLTPADLAVYYRQNAWLCWLFFFGCLTLLLFGYWNIIRGYRWSGATVLIYSAVLFLWFVKASWKCWIIDQRAIHPISAWVRTPIAWHPPLEIPKWLTVGLCSIFLLCIIPPAQAVFVSDIFRPPDTDLSVWMLREALGPLVAEEMGGSSANVVVIDVITWMLSHIVIPLGGIILLYSSYLGLSHAGMSAELFGDKKQAYWVAARTIFAFGMVTPAPGLNGLALINLFVITWTLHGAGAASSLWVQVSKSLTSTAISGNPNQVSKDLFDKMLLGEMCAAAYNEYAIKQSGYSEDYLVSFKSVGQSAGAGGTSKASVWVWSQKDTFQPFCGQIIAKTVEKVDSQGVSIPSRTSTVASDASAAVRTALVSAEVNAIASMQTMAQSLATNIIAGGATAPSTDYYKQEIEWLAQNRQSAALSAAQTLTSDISAAWNDAAAQDGWALAGFYFAGFGMLQSSLDRAAAATWLEARVPNKNDVIGKIGNEKVHGSVMKAMELMEGYIESGHTVVDNALAIERQAQAADASSSFGVVSSANWVTKGFNDLFKGWATKESNPLEMMISLGMASINIGLGVTAADFAIPGLGKYAISKTVELVFLAFGILFVVVGAFLPSLIWLTIILRWLFSALIAQFATPIWMVLHAHPEGDGIAGAHASAGYMLMLTLLFSPILNLTALIVVYNVMVIMGKVMNKVMYPIVTGVDVGWLTPFFYVVIYGAALYMVIKLCMEEMTGLASGVLDWIGGGRSNPADSDSGHVHSLMMAGFLFVNNRMRLGGNGLKKQPENRQREAALSTGKSSRG